MNNLFIDFVSRIEVCPDVSDIKLEFENFLSDFGFELFAYALVPREFDFHIPATLLNNMPSDWMDRYNSMNYAQHDWSIKYCMRNLVPIQVDLDKLPECIKNDRKALKVMREARELVVNSLIFPCRTEGLVGTMGIHSNLSEREFTSVCQEYESIINLAATYTHFSLVERGYSAFSEPVGFTAKARDVLLFKSQGLATKEIAKKMNIAEVTVNFHWQNIARKLRVQTPREIVPKALKYGLIG